jgi:hypothetical protein
MSVEHMSVSVSAVTWALLASSQKPTRLPRPSAQRSQSSSNLIRQSRMEWVWWVSGFTLFPLAGGPEVIHLPPGACFLIDKMGCEPPPPTADVGTSLGDAVTVF